MSRLDSAIRRLEAQRACLDRAAELIADLPGPILELGLGNGRTYDHLREICPEREIFVFERKVAAHPDCIPDQAHLLLGDIRETLPQAVARFGATAAMAHTDIGTGDSAANTQIAAYIASQLPDLMRSGGVVVSDQDLGLARAVAIGLPDRVKPGRYYMYRAD